MRTSLAVYRPRSSVDGALARALDLRDDRLPVTRSDQAGRIVILRPSNRGPMGCWIQAKGFQGKLLKGTPLPK
ncbi:MAG: hypothetical protein ACRD1R_02230 [Acidobacteriota bacterium]